VSRLSLSILVLAISFVTLLRLLIPPFDEPDFLSRVERLIDIFSGFLGNDVISSLFVTLKNQISNGALCGAQYSVETFWAHIDDKCIEQSISLAAARFLSFLVFNAPLLLIILFWKQVTSFILLFSSKDHAEIQRRMLAVSMSILFPSVAYFLSLISFKTFFVSLTLLLLLVWDIPILLFVLLSVCFIFDNFNFLPLLVFVSCLTLFTRVERRSYVFLLLILVGSILTFVFFFSYEIIDAIAHLSGKKSKFSQLRWAFDTYDFDSQYPRWVRPAHTGLSLTFMTANGLKSIFLYLGILFFAVHFFVSGYLMKKKIGMRRHTLGVSFHIALSSVVTVLVTVFLLPNYAYGKYFVFLVPFLLYAILRVIEARRLMVFLLFSQLIVLINILLFYI
jgi:hypothetical protein